MGWGVAPHPFTHMRDISLVAVLAIAVGVIVYLGGIGGFLVALLRVLERVIGGIHG